MRTYTIRFEGTIEVLAESVGDAIEDFLNVPYLLHDFAEIMAVDKTNSDYLEEVI